jgi:glutathione S-transferase
MITVYGEGRGFRVVWLLEEMGIAYALRPVDMLAGVEKDTEFMAINPGGFIPAIHARNFAPEGLGKNWSADHAQRVFDSRLRLVTRELERSPYMAGELFTAADISVTYALELAYRAGGVTLGASERAYVARTSARQAYQRAMATCHATRAWAERSPPLDPRVPPVTAPAIAPATSRG